MPSFPRPEREWSLCPLFVACTATLLCSTTSQSLRYFANRDCGNTFADESSARSFLSSRFPLATPVTTVAVGDTNNDGLPDLFVGFKAATPKFYTNTAGSRTWSCHV